MGVLAYGHIVSMLQCFMISILFVLYFASIDWAEMRTGLTIGSDAAEVNRIVLLILSIFAQLFQGRETARMAKVMGMHVIAANRKGKKESIKGFLIEGTGDENGGGYCFIVAFQGFHFCRKIDDQYSS